jgi:hypothetical protein
MRLSTILAWLGVSCALLGLLAWVGYGAFATRAIHLVISRDPATAHRVALYADAFHFAQLLLGTLAVGLGWSARVRAEGSKLARMVRFSALCLGVVVLSLMMLLV